MRGVGKTSGMAVAIVCAALLALLALPVVRAGAAAGTGLELEPGTLASALTLGPEGDFWFAGSDYSPAEYGDSGIVGRLAVDGTEQEFPFGAAPQTTGGSTYRRARRSRSARTATSGSAASPGWGRW